MIRPSGSADIPGGSSRTGKKPRARKLARWFGWCCLLVLLVYGVSNLWLLSGWGTGMAESRLKERTGMDWEIDSMSWSPWNGISINRARMLQPESLRELVDEPVLAVEKIRVRPYWSRLFRGRLRPREITVETPRFYVPVEMLASLAAQIAPDKIKAPAAAQPPKPSEKPPEKKTEPKPPETPSKEPNKPKSQPRPPAAKKEPEVPPAALPVQLTVTNASLHLVSASKDIELVELEGIGVDISLLGEDSTGVITVASANAPGLPGVRDISQAVVWKRPYLEIKEQTVDLDRLKIRMAARLGLGRTPSGRFPFLLDVAVDPQAFDSGAWFERLALVAKASRVSGRFRVNGALPSPASWRGEARLSASDVVLRENHGGHDVVFDEVSLPAVIRQGQLRWSSVRMIGEDVSVLGNGRLSAHDGILCVTRLVVSPEVAVMISRAICGSHIAKYGWAWWQNLDTPDRKMRDVLVSGSLTDPVADIDYRHNEVPVIPAVRAALKFIREEMKEEGKDLAPLPNKRLLERKHHAHHRR